MSIHNARQGNGIFPPPPPPAEDHLDFPLGPPSWEPAWRVGSWCPRCSDVIHDDWDEVASCRFETPFVHNEVSPCQSCWAVVSFCKLFDCSPTVFLYGNLAEACQALLQLRRGCPAGKRCRSWHRLFRLGRFVDFASEVPFDLEGFPSLE